MLAVKGGGMVSHTVGGNGGGTANQSNGINILSNITGVGDIIVNLSLIIGIASSITGTGQVNASLSQLIKLVATLAGNGQTQASLSLLAGISSLLTGTNTMSASLRGTQTMATDISPFTELSPQNLSQSVWEYATRTLTSGGSGGGGLTTEQDEKLTRIDERVDMKVSESIGSGYV